MGAFVGLSCPHMAKGKTLNARIVAFSPPSVKGGQVALRVMMVGLDVAELSFDPVLGMELAAALRALLGEKKAPSKKRGPKISADTLDAYRRVVRDVNEGATWAAAARAEGVEPVRVRAWWDSRQRRTAKRAGKAPILKPSGEIS